MRRIVLAAVIPVALAAAGAVPASGKTAYPTAVKGSLQQAFVAQRYLGPKKVTQQNKPTHYKGAPLVLQAAYISRQASEPTIGVDAKGVAFMTASAFDS